MLTDSIADCLTRVRNAAMAGHKELQMPHSKMKFSVLEILHKQGYLGKVEVVADDKGGHKKKIVAALVYKKDGQPAFERLTRVSTPGQRVYRKRPEKLEVRSGFGVQILSTSKGLMTDKEAIEKKVGGELIAEVW